MITTIAPSTRQGDAMTTQQAIHLHPGGWRRLRRFSRLYEAWLILTGAQSLHRAWQRGYDQHIMDDSTRRARGGK